MANDPVFQQRKGTKTAASEAKVRRAGERGVVIDFTQSLAEKNPFVPVFDENALPSEVLIPGQKDYLMVHLVFTFKHFDEDARRWTVEAVTYPRIKGIDVLRKLDEHLFNLEAWLMELANHPTHPAILGSTETLTHYIRKEFPATDSPEQTLMHLQWSEGLRRARAAQVARYEQAMQAAVKRAMEPRIVREVPQWWPLPYFPRVQRALTRTVTYPPTHNLAVPTEEEQIMVPDVDPWDELFLDLAASKRVPRVDRALESMYKLLVIEQEGGLPKLRKNGFELILAKTRILNPSAPISERLWGKAGNTIVQADPPPRPPVNLA